MNEAEDKLDIFWASFEEYPELKLPHIKIYAGQNLYGGWENSAICLFGNMSQDVKAARLDAKGRAWETNLLEKLQASVGLVGKISETEKKKSKKHHHIVRKIRQQRRGLI